MDTEERNETLQRVLDQVSHRGKATLDAVRSDLEDLAEKFSGARLERVVLGDGRSFVLKHLPSEGDWLTRTTGATGRVSLLWSAGILHEVESAVDHATFGCIETETGWVVVMRDVSNELVPPAVPVSRSTSLRLLGGLARLHDVRVNPVDGLCPVSARYRLFAPEFHRRDTGAGQHPMRDAIVSGWERFFELVPGVVGDAVAMVHRNPDALGAALERFPHVLLHGDAKLENMGLGGDKLVLIDWGDLTGFGPAEVDVVWYALKSAPRISVEPDQLFADYEATSGRSLLPEALDLACLGALAQMGFRMANSAALGRPEPRAIGTALLSWWTGRVMAALDSRPIVEVLAT